ncbi:MAG TPA: alpha/beta fold hydrolase [Planctomycetota bacterium]|nr:alpha/beta fold hydrolase [Planctomycetota bacterium]
MNLQRLLQITSRRVVRVGLHLAGLLLAVLATIVIGFAVQARLRLPDLQPWHRIVLAEEFHAGAATASTTFADYLAREERLFAELQARVLQAPGAADRGPANRYDPASVPGQLAASEHGNRSYEQVPAEVRGAVLLVHGLSDSPYSMHALADWYFARGFYVLSLRLPGHGTLPSGLLDVRWQDWYEAVRLAAVHVRARAGGKPFHACGYSTGAAVLTLLAARSSTDDSLPRPDRLVLLSAAIGVSKFAALANVASALAFVPYFEKADWLDVLPEFDPYKYNSFTVNAGNQIHRLTQELRAEFARAAAAGRLAHMPKILACQSVIDATVNAADVVHELLQPLPAGGHELIVFDVNRSESWSSLIAPGPREAMQRIREAPELPFRLTLVGNESAGSQQVAAYTREAGSRETKVEALALAWPRGVFSVGHVALPFAIDDPIYGLLPRAVERLPWPLGATVPRGEAGVTLVPFGDLARLRCNPFLAVILDRVGAAVDADLRH